MTSAFNMIPAGIFRMLAGAALIAGAPLLAAAPPPPASAALPEIAVNLHPVPACIQAQAAGLAVPFYQAVPVPKGKLALPMEGLNAAVGGRAIPAAVAPVAHWPDGSVQWAALSGVWPADIPLADNTSVQLQPAAKNPAPAPAFEIKADDAGMVILDRTGQSLARLRPAVSLLRITQRRPTDSRRPADLDKVVQYSWAAECANLHPAGAPVKLGPRLTELVVESETPSAIVYRARGAGGASAPGCDLEWQLRAQVFRATPVIRFQATWFCHWNPDEFALASAEWAAEFDRTFTTANIAGRAFDLAIGPVSLATMPDGQSRLAGPAGEVVNHAWPAVDLHYCALESGAGAIGLAFPDFTRLGPNRLRLDAASLTWSGWDGSSGLALDLRNGLTSNDFSVIDCDFSSRAEGLARTVEMVWVLHSQPAAAAQLARLEAARAWLWFPSRSDLIRSQALGAWREAAFARNRTYLEGLSAEFHWLMASRDYWRWNGFINFGDIRTNFGGPDGTRDKAQQLLRVFPMMWGMDGRYGWRHGSAEPYRGFLTFGLWMEDRDLLLFALDYARHVADVDVVHGRFSGPPPGNAGGMHRRNKYHWSGAVQMQYTPSRGLYMAKWLSGFARFDETLDEIRGFARRHPDSVYAASAWLNRYVETGAPADLAQAEKLLDRTVEHWERINQRREEWRGLRGLAALHAGNFRLPLDWWPVQVEFHRATGRAVYADIMAETAATQARGISDFSGLYPMAYLLSQGYARERLGGERVDRMRSQLEKYLARQYAQPPPRAEWNYETLAPQYPEQSAIMGWRAAFAPLALSWFCADPCPP